MSRYKGPTIAEQLESWDRVTPIPGLMDWDLDTGCFNWMRNRNKHGYGLFKLYGRRVTATRYLLGILDEDPRYVHAMHRCDNPRCVCLSHLEIGNGSINQRQSYDRGRNTQLGSKNTKALLNEEQVREIKIKINNGLTLVSIAAEYSVHPGTIKSIKRELSWSHILI